MVGPLPYLFTSNHDLSGEGSIVCRPLLPEDWESYARTVWRAWRILRRVLWEV